MVLGTVRGVVQKRGPSDGPSDGQVPLYNVIFVSIANSKREMMALDDRTTGL